MEEFKENLLNWYEFEKESEILILEENCTIFSIPNCKMKAVDLSSKSIKLKTELTQNKYNYIILVGMLAKIKNYIQTDENADSSSQLSTRENLLNLANQALKPNGKILIAEDNKFGIKNWNGKRDTEGSLDYRELTRKYNASENGLLAKNEIIKLLKNAQFENYKFYYMYPDFNFANVIFTDEYKFTEEDVSRNFEAYEENELVNFNENLALLQIVKENPELAKFFANSFLVEASSEPISADVKYVSFTNYRRKEYRIATILKQEVVQKKAVNSASVNHIKKIAENLKLFPVSESVDLLDKQHENCIESKFIKNTPRLDLYLNSLQNSDEFINEFAKYKDVVYKHAVPYEEVKSGVMLEPVKQYEKVSKLHFLKNGFIDMIPKNCFKINEKYSFFDQEWLEENIPAEYVIYRAIINTVFEEEKEKTLLEKFEILEHKDLFEKLEESFRQKVIDEKMLYDVFDKKVVTREAILGDLNSQIIDRNRKIEELELENKNLKIDIEGRKAHVEELLGVIQEKENQIITISNSLSWRITKPLRDVSGKIHDMKNKSGKTE